MVEAIILGIGIGLVSSFVTGPVFFSMIKTSIEKGFIAGISLASGVIIADFTLITLILFGSQFFAYQGSFDKYVGIIGGLFILGIGIYYLWAKVTMGFKNDEIEKISKRNYLIKGFLMSILTPSTLMFWVVVSGIVSVKLGNDIYVKLVCFTLGLITQLSIDAFKTFYASELRNKITLHTLSKLNKVAGVIIIGFAVWLLLKTYWQFYA